MDGMGWEESSPSQHPYNLSLWEHLVELKRIKKKETIGSPSTYFLGSEKSHSNPLCGPDLPCVMSDAHSTK